jgi:PIN domain nuclease of toxin-antitoxin system
VTALLLDTHAWVWSLMESHRLPPLAAKAIETATQVLVSPISFFEIAQKVRVGKWPEMVPYVAQLPALLGEQGSYTADFTSEIALLAGSLDWRHRDPFDRFLAATALKSQIALVSADPVFDGIVPRIW